MSKNREENLYPSVSLHDCSIEKIEIEGSDIKVKFSKYGFIKKHDDGHYYGVSNASLVINNVCDIENVYIKEIRTHKVSDDVYFDSAYYVDGKNFINNINSKKWHFVVTEEYYAIKKALYVGQITEGKNRFFCVIKIMYDTLIYEWQDIIKDYLVY